MVNSPDGVNLRAGPGTTFPVLSVLTSGTAVTVTGDATGDGWLPVTVNNQLGFVKAEYVTAQPAPAATPAALPPVVALPPLDAVPPQYATVTPPDGLNLRRGPGASYSLVATVPGGARVQVFGRPNADGWQSVVYNNRSGWVDGRYIQMTGQSVTLSSAASAPAATPTPTPSAPARWIWPTASRRISTVFSASEHPGIDIDEFPTGNNPVLAAAAGRVTFAGGNPCCSYGLYVVVTHPDGYTTLYSHMGSVAVREGEEVRQGTMVGRSGCTGRCTGVHVHLEIRKDGVALNPLTLLAGPYSIE